jgi:hypothetical protein
MDNLRKVENKNSNFFSKKTIEKIQGFTTSILHLFVINAIYLIAVFSFNITTLMITGAITTIILIFNIILHDCPLSNIEEHRNGDTVTDLFNRWFPINYDKSRRYEVQLQYIFIAISIIITKILFYLMKKDLKNFLDISYTI